MLKKISYSIFLSVVVLSQTTNGMEMPQSPIIIFKKNYIYPGRIQDLETVSRLIEMASEAFENLTNANIPVQYNPFILFHISKHHACDAQELGITRSTLKNLIKLIMQDGGKIKEWSFGKILTGLNVNVQLIAKNGKSLSIEGPILDVAGKFSKPNKELEAKSCIEIQKLIKRLND